MSAYFAKDSDRRLPARTRRAGSVLVLVLWVSLGLVALALTFGHSMMMTYRSADNDLAGHQAEQAIEGAVRYAQMLMENVEKPGQLPDVESYTAENVPVGEATFWFLGRSMDDQTGATQVFELVDESSKLNLNIANEVMLVALPGMTQELAAAIIDWRDSNDDVNPNGGAESETYMLRQPSYAAKNANFESVEELALVNGADPLILYGEDANLNGVLDPNEDDGSVSAPEDDSNGRLEPGILQYVTALSREPANQTDGTTPRVNVSTARSELDALIRRLFESGGDAIIGRLGTTPLRNVTEFIIRGGLSVEEEIKIAEEITDPRGVLGGRVNVNTASEAVLACIPGIGVDKASTLVATRQSRAEKDTSIKWIVPVLGDAGAITAGNYITGSSYQVSADVAAVGRHGRGYRRTRFVIDMSTGAPRIIHRRNLSPLGWALGSDVRQTLAARKELQ